MGLAMRDEVTRLRISKNSSTTETAKLQTRLDCCLEKLGKCSSSTVLLFSIRPKEIPKERIEKKEQKGEKRKVMNKCGRKEQCL